MVTPDARRKSPRAELKWPVTVEFSGNELDGEIKNISVDGAYVICRKLPDSGEIVNLTIRPNTYTEMHVKAEIIWTSSGQSSGGGLAFSEISAEVRHYISEAVLTQG